MQEMEHEAWCDRDHTPRQRCNAALAPLAVTDAPSISNGASATNQTAGVAGEPASAETASEQERSAPEPSVLQRDVAVAAGVPSPSPYASQAWERTEDRLEEPGGQHDPDAGSQPHEERAAVPRVAMLAAVLALVVALLIAARRLLRR